MRKGVKNMPSMILSFSVFWPWVFTCTHRLHRGADACYWGFLWDVSSSKLALWNILEVNLQMCLGSSLYGEKAMQFPERTNEMAGVYARQCVELAKDLGIRAIDLWSKMQGTDGWQKKFLRFVIFKALITWNLWISENVLRFLYSFTQAAPRIYFVFTAISFQQIHLCFDVYFSGLKGDW